jgi:arylsulfatase A-like enzyme
VRVKNKRRDFLKAVAVLAVAPIAFGKRKDDRPNIIVVLSDDMGFSDIGCYGSEIKTPSLDGLAANGLRFSQFYNGARCCPTRASILTGLHPHQTGIGHMSYGTYPEGTNPEGYANDLNNRCVTIAQALKPAGYRNYCVGKWHVASDTAPDGPKHNWPLQRGFDKYYGMIGGAGSFYDPTKLCRGNTLITPVNDPLYQPAGTYYFTEAITDNALMYLREHGKQDSEKPFFMYLAYTAAHWPMHALERDIEKYKGRYDGGYATIRQARYEKAQALGLLDPAWTLSAAPAKWEDQPYKEWEARCMEVYAAMIDCMDQGIGKIAAELERQGKLDNTLILYLQDNGGCDENLGREDNKKWHLKGIQPMEPDELQEKTWPPMRTRDGRPVRGGPDVMPGAEDTFVAYGRNWANVSNTPFREYKHYVHEGGISSALVAHWPNGIAARGGITHEPGHIIDIMATCVDLAEAPYPKAIIQPLEGVSLVPIFKGGRLEERILYWEHEGNRAIRDGDWKLVAKGWSSPWELFNLKDDRTEMNNLVKQYPERAAAMEKRWLAHAQRTNILPWPWGPYGSAPALKQGDVLTGKSAPDVANCGFRLSAEIEGSEGVILSQGGATLGYALFLQNGKLHFVVRTAQDHVQSLEAPFTRDSGTVGAKLNPDGTMELAIDGRCVSTGNGRLIPRQPLGGLGCGLNEGTAVGEYEIPFRFMGQIKTASVEVLH